MATNPSKASFNSPFLGLGVLASAFGLAVLLSNSTVFSFTAGYVLRSFAASTALSLPVFLAWRYAIPIGRKQSLGAAFNVFALFTVGAWLFLSVPLRGLLPSFFEASGTQTRLQSERVTRDHPTYATEGWTQESTGTTEAGPWLQYDPPGTRYYRDANRIIYRVYPPGVRPDAPSGNPFGVGDSTAEVPK